MKILRLALSAYGPFTDVALDLSAGREGLHLIYGPNEAGKSSALRALRQLFFEFDRTTPDDFLHPYANLRLGASIRNGDGHVFEFVRRKGTKNTLIAADGKTPLDEADLARYLGGLTKERFASLFAIDHAELVAGGRALIQGGGHLGQALFATGSGLAGLLDVQRGLEREMEALFKPGGSKPKINADLAALADAVKTWKSDALPSSAWLEHKEAHEGAVARLGRLNAELESAASERHRLARLRDALPLLADRTRCLAELEAVGDAIALPEGFTEQRIKAQADRDAATLAERSAREALAELDRQLAEIVVPEPLLAEADTIEPLRDALARHRDGQSEAPRLAGELHRIEADAASLLRDLRPGLALEDAQTLRLTRPQRSAIQALASEKAALDAEHAAALDDHARTLEALDAVARETEQLEPPRDATELVAALKRLRDQGDLAALQAAERRRLDQLEGQAARDLRALPLWSGPLDALDALAVPSLETIDRFKDRWRQADEALASIQAALDSERRKQADADLRIEQLRLGGDVPTEDDLAAARARRDDLWHRARLALEGKQSTPANLPDAFEQALADADDLADRLRREAGRVADLASARLARRIALETIEALETRRLESETARDALAREWSALWSPLGLDPLPPAEMLGWVQKQQALTQRAREIRDQRAAAEALDQQVAHHRRALESALEPLGAPRARPSESLTTLRDRAERLAACLEATEAARADLARQAAQLRRNADAARRRASDAEGRLQAWRARWAEALAPLGLENSTSPEHALDVVEQAAALLAHLDDARDLRGRIEALENDAQRFAAEVHTLCGRVAPDLAPLPCEQAARDLLARLKDAVARCTQRDTLLRQRAQELDRANLARDRIATATSLLGTLAREARCASPDDLPEAERLSAGRLALESKLRQLDDQLLRLAAGHPIESLASDAEAVDPDRLPLRIAQLTETITGLEAEKTELNQAIGREDAELKRMDGSARAAEAAEQAEHLRARILADVDQYTRLRLASAVLREAIERFRQKTQGPVLARAGALFATLTLGSFEDLRVDYNDADEPVLKGIRPGGKQAVGVEGMSDGTADQLYLALRIAVLENYLERHDPVPFIVDDILARFDNDRSLATLTALAELSKRTQVLVFTHHDHLRTLAEAHLDPSVLFVHHLSPQPAQAGSKRR